MKKVSIWMVALTLLSQNGLAARKDWNYVSAGVGYNVVSDFYLKDVDGDTVEENLHFKFKGGPISDLAIGRVFKNGFGANIQHSYGRVKLNSKKSTTPEATFVDADKSYLDMNSVYGNLYYTLRTRGARPFVGAGYGVSYKKLKFSTSTGANTDQAKSDGSISVTGTQIFGGFSSAISRDMFVDIKYTRRFWNPEFKLKYGSNAENSLKIKVKEHSDIMGVSLGYRF